MKHYASDVAGKIPLEHEGSSLSDRRIRQLAVFRITAATFFSTVALGLAIYDVRLGLAAFGGLAIAAALRAGLAGGLPCSHADVVVRIGTSEVRIRLVNLPFDGEYKQAFLSGLADYVLRQLHAQTESRRDR